MPKAKDKLRSRRQARHIWESYHKSSLLPGIQIHHLDGNPFNNAISNLKAVNPEEHWLIHFKQGDSVALRGNFIQFGNNYLSLTPEEQKEKMKKLSRAGQNKWKNDPKWREEMIKNHRLGKNNPFYGRHHTEETKKKISAIKRPSGKDHYFYGKKHTKEHKKLMSEARKGLTAGIKNPRWKGYIHTPFGTYNTSYEAEKALGINSRNIRYRCDNDTIEWKDWHYSKEL